jgi:hypothetical protein
MLTDASRVAQYSWAMSSLKLGCLIATSMTLGAVIGYLAFNSHGLAQWVGGAIGGVLGLIASLAAANLLDWLLEQSDESVRPYG